MKRAFSFLVGISCLVGFLTNPVPAQESIGSQWQLVRTIALPDGVNAVAVSPDASLVVAHSALKMTLWDGETGAALGTLFETDHKKSEYPGKMCFSPDGKTLVVGIGYHSNGRLAFFDLATKIEIFSQPTGSGRPMAIAYSHDGRYIAYSFRGENGLSIEVLDTTTKRKIKRLRGGRYPVTALAWQVDGQTLLSVSGGKKKYNGYGPLQSEFIRWDIETGEILAKHYLQPGSSNAVFNNDGTLLAAMGGEIKKELRETGTPQMRWLGQSVAIYSIPKTDAAPALLAKLEDANLLNRLAYELDPQMSWSGDSKLLAFPQGGQMEGNLLLWDLRNENGVTGRIVAGGEMKNDGKDLNGVSFSKKGATLAVSGYRQLLIWNKKAGG